MLVVTKQRKTNFLTPSALRCLAEMPTVNISAGCPHKCVYCYAIGYSVYPGDNVIEIYADMAERIACELSRKRKRPKAVYFCPSCDPFGPLEQIQNTSFEVMKTLLNKSIGVQFLTKGKIAEQILQLFEHHSNLICGQIGISTVDDSVRQIFEPNTATVAEKLSQLERLVRAGIKTSVRCDPLFYGLTDSHEQLEKLFASIVRTGCKEAAVGYLFLRPAIIKNLKHNISNKMILDRILKPYEKGICLPVGIKTTGLMLPTEIRRAGFERIKNTADKFGISTHICGCKNSDITCENCYIIRPPCDANEQLLF
jgi:DNA repair photolyase